MVLPTTVRHEVQVGIGQAGLPLGTLVYARQGRREHCAFAYDTAWLNSAERFSVSADLQLVPGYQAHKAASAHDSVFHGAIADTAPDAWGRRVIIHRMLGTKGNDANADRGRPSARNAAGQ